MYRKLGGHIRIELIVIISGNCCIYRYNGIFYKNNIELEINTANTERFCKVD